MTSLQAQLAERPAEGEADTADVVRKLNDKLAAKKVKVTLAVNKRMDVMSRKEESCQSPMRLRSSGRDKCAPAYLDDFELG